MITVVYIQDLNNKDVGLFVEIAAIVLLMQFSMCIENQ